MGTKRKLTEEQEKELCKKYNTNKVSITEISNMFGVCKRSVFNVLSRNGVRPTHSYEYNKSVFSNELTEEKAYWVGFLMADGCVVKDRLGRKTVSVQLQSQDKHHLEKLRAFICPKKPIYEKIYYHKKFKKTFSSCTLSFSGDDIRNDLIGYGVVCRKSTSEFALKDINNNRHFWRGVIDGDGSVCEYKEKSRKTHTQEISLYGSKQLLEQFISFINLNIFETKRIPNKKNSGNCYQVHFTSKKARILVDYFYSNCNIYLDRKYIIAQKMINGDY